MHPVVHYRLIPRRLMPYGPATIALTPGGQLVALVDAACIDPVLPQALADLGTALMCQFVRLAVPASCPEIQVRINPVYQVSGGPVAAEVTPRTIDVLVDRDLIRPELAVDLGRHATRIMRHFT